MNIQLFERSIITSTLTSPKSKSFFSNTNLGKIMASINDDERSLTSGSPRIKPHDPLKYDEAWLQKTLKCLNTQWNEGGLGMKTDVGNVTFEGGCHDISNDDEGHSLPKDRDAVGKYIVWHCLHRDQMSGRKIIVIGITFTGKPCIQTLEGYKGKLELVALYENIVDESKPFDHSGYHNTLENVEFYLVAKCFFY